MLDELRYMNLQDLYEKMRLLNQEFDEWLESMGLLYAFQVCDFCEDHMKPDGRSRTWICHKCDCLRDAGGKKFQKRLLVGAFFEESNKAQGRGTSGVRNEDHACQYRAWVRKIPEDM
uniref:Uncharacterized protein n=1 Tax=Acrobeloides nanus TaxID=290746 RepID=A0A914ER91_9BILA